MDPSCETKPKTGRVGQAATGGDKRAKQSQFPPRADAMDLETARSYPGGSGKRSPRSLPMVHRIRKTTGKLTAATRSPIAAVPRSTCQPLVSLMGRRLTERRLRMLRPGGRNAGRRS